MLSRRTCLEISYVLEDLREEEIDRIFILADITTYKGGKNKASKISTLLDFCKSNLSKGPLGNTWQMDLLQLLVSAFYRKNQPQPEWETVDINYEMYGVVHADYFAHKYPMLSNSLRQDGFVIKGELIQKMLPEEIAEVRTENELEKLLIQFSFTVAINHLREARDNHARGNWPAANAMFRSFIESLLIETAKLLISSFSGNGASQAIKALAVELEPPFLAESLNEIRKDRAGFVEALWNRLHPHGSHPGTSDEEDSTFRYHISVVLAHYLLKRLQARKS